MSIYLGRFPLQSVSRHVLQRKSFSCGCPERGNFFSTTFKVNFFVYMCTSMLFGTTYKTATLIKEDTLEIKRQLKELTKK